MKEKYWSLKKQIFESADNYEDKVKKFKEIIRDGYLRGEIISVSQFSDNMGKDSRSFHHSYIMSGRIDVIWIDDEIGCRKNVRTVFLCKDETIRDKRIDLDYKTNEIVSRSVKDLDRLPAKYETLWKNLGIEVDQKKFDNVTYSHAKDIYEMYADIKQVQVTTSNKYAENQCMRIKIDVEKLDSIESKVNSLTQDVFPLNVLYEIDSLTASVGSESTFDVRKFLELFYSDKVINDREREIIDRLYNHHETTSSVANLTNLSTSRISRIKLNAIDKFKKPDVIKLFTIDLYKQNLIDDMSNELDSLRRSLKDYQSMNSSLLKVDNLRLSLVLSNQRLKRVLETLNLHSVGDLIEYIRNHGLSSINEYPSIGNKAYQSLLTDFRNHIGVDLELYERT